LTAARLNPRDPSAALFPSWVVISYYYERDYARAVATAKAVVERYPNYPLIYRWLAAALGQLGRTDEAREALKRAVEKISPESFDLHLRSRPPWYRPEDHEHMLDGLRKAGWQS
jgi:adenylate cyclase